MHQLTTKPIFGGHEKFPFRYGWLKKGVDAATEDPTVFAKDMSLVRLGVGKNMVRSIRHWCLATNLLTEVSGKGRAKNLVKTSLADRLFAADGWDPYLEDIGSYWLVHWELATNLERSLVWHFLFAEFYELEFSKAQLQAFCNRQLESAGVSTTVRTIEREVDCCLRSYVPPQARSSKQRFSEDSLSCPLVELELLRYVADDNIYRFNVGPKETLPPAVFGYALLRFLAPIASTRRTIALDDCLYYPGSPGQVFKLDENSLVEYMEELESMTQGSIRMQESAGLRQLYLDDSLVETVDADSFQLLERYYA